MNLYFYKGHLWLESNNVGSFSKLIGRYFILPTIFVCGTETKGETLWLVEKLS